MGKIYIGDKAVSQIDLTLVSGNEIVKIDDGITQVDKFIEYLNATQINISDHKNMIVYFESYDYNDTDYYDFIVIPTNYDTQGLLIDSNGYLYTLMANVASGSLVYSYEAIGGGGDLSNYYTKAEIDAKFSDIDTILDEINGEVV